jgi:hypothetical protein
MNGSASIDKKREYSEHYCHPFLYLKIQGHQSRWWEDDTGGGEFLVNNVNPTSRQDLSTGTILGQGLKVLITSIIERLESYTSYHSRAILPCCYLITQWSQYNNVIRSGGEMLKRGLLHHHQYFPKYSKQ